MKEAKTLNLLQSPRGFNPLLTLYPSIIDIREYILQQEKDNKRASYKLTSCYPYLEEEDCPINILSKDVFVSLLGEKASLSIQKLYEHHYLQKKNDQWIITWRLRQATLHDFHVHPDKEKNRQIFQTLHSLLWESLPKNQEEEAFLRSFSAPNGKNPYPINDKEYWFRLGKDLTAIRFQSLPSQEFLEILSEKIRTIQREKLYTEIRRKFLPFGTDSKLWEKQNNQQKNFFQCMKDLCQVAEHPFALEHCEISITMAGKEGTLITGNLVINFDADGTPYSSYNKAEKELPNAAAEDGCEFLVKERLVGGGYSAQDFGSLSLFFRSRSMGNLDPKKNPLICWFTEIFFDLVVVLAAVMIPIKKNEDVLSHLRWRYFLDFLRLQNFDLGEDLHRIVETSLRLLRYFFGFREASLFSEDHELTHMLTFFSRQISREIPYKILAFPLSPAEILQEQYILIPIREVEAGRVILYVKLPPFDRCALNNEDNRLYLNGSFLWHDFKQESARIGITEEETEGYLFFLITECLSGNPKKILTNLSHHWPIRNRWPSIEIMRQITVQLLKRYSHFFDLIQTFRDNFEFSLAFLRGRRDSLTSLYNRQYFRFLIKKTFLRPFYSVGLMFLDMDNFKILNDLVSHDFGDRFLIALADRLFEAVEKFKSEIVPGRLGGDEFCLLIGGIEKMHFEAQAVEIFTLITHKPVKVLFCLDEHSDEGEMRINLIAFLHRLMRPDVGNRQVSRTEFSSNLNHSPCNHVVRIWKHYQELEGRTNITGMKVKSTRIINDLSIIMEEKLLHNKILTEIDPTFRILIHSFLSLQMANHKTNHIRKILTEKLKADSFPRSIFIHVSAGLAHSTEDRLRSADSLFKAADSRAYLAKHNGRNCLFGIQAKQLV